MRIKKIVCTILSLVCMFFLGIGILLQNPVQAKAESPTVTVAINQNVNNGEWPDSQKRVLLDVVDIATGTTASFTAWENMTSVIGNGVTMNGTGKNLNFFGSTGDGVSVIYPFSLEDGAVFSIADGTVINGYVFPEFTIALVNGVWHEITSVTINNIHNRFGGAQRLLLFLSESDYATANTGISAKIANTNVLDYVNVYTSKTEYKTLREIYQGDAQAQIWGEANSVGFQIDDNYHGTAIYAVEIKAGAQFPAATSDLIYIVSEDTTYYNNDYQSANAELNGWSVSWAKGPNLVREEVTVTKIHNRNGGVQRLLLFLSNSDYATANTNISAKIANTNVLDYVNVYTSKTEYKTLREIYQGDAQAQIWGEANSVGFQIDDNYHGTAVYAVEIKAGAHFPAATNDYKMYVVSEDITYCNNDYQSADTSLNGWAVSWTSIPKRGTPDVEFVEIHSANNNSVWGGSTRAVRLTFNKNFTAKAYSANEGGFEAPIIADVRYFTKINGQSLGDVTFLQAENENSITFLYNESLLAVPEGQDYTTFTIEAGAPFGGHYLPAVTLYFVDGAWCENKPVTKSVTIDNIHNRNGGGQKLLLFLSESDYGTANTDITAKIANTNVLDYVNVYTSETEYKTLREIYQNSATSNIWGEANSVGFAVNANYHGTAVYAIEIKKGAQFPAATNDYTTYVVSADITYYNNSYQSTDTNANGYAVSWTTVKPVEPEEPELGTPDVEFIGIHNDNNNSVWGGATRAVRLVFSKNFDAKAYDKNEGGFDAPTIAAVRNFTKINGQSLGNLSLLQIDNENSITFLYDESLLALPAGQEYTTFTIEAGAPFGGHYLPEITLYLIEGKWSEFKPVHNEIKELVLSDLYVEGKVPEATKTGEVTLETSGDYYKGYVGSNVYFNLELELSYANVVGENQVATFDVKMTNVHYKDGASPFYLSWHVYYQRPANTLFIEYYKYNKYTGARETFATAVSDVSISANTIYQANFAYQVIDKATGAVELYSNIAGWENTLTWKLGAEYVADAAYYEYLVFSSEASVKDADITFADPGLAGKKHYDVTLSNGDTTILSGENNQIQLPSLDNVVVEERLSQVFVGWTTNLGTLPDLYPAGYKLKLTQATQLYAVWIGFELEDGASVRVVENSSGIRFTTKVDSADYKKLGGYISGTGTLVVPTEYLTKVEFVHSSFGEGYYMDVKTDTWRENSEGKSVWSYAAALVNIHGNQYARLLSARGYLKINFTSGEGYVYTPYTEENNSRSIYEVATAAYNDTKKDYKNNTQILEYVNSVADITLSKEMDLSKLVDAVGDYTLTDSSLEEKTFTVSLSRDITSVMINGTRIASGAKKNVRIGDFIFSIKDVEIHGSEVIFTIGAASDLNDKYSDDNTYFRSSDAELDLFLNDYFTRHATGMYENGEDQTVNSVVAGDNSEEFFWWEWFSTAYYTMDTNSGFDRIAGLREKLSNVPVDDYGYVWQNTDRVRDAKSTLASAEHRMGWPFPTANEMVVKNTSERITKGYSTSWDFNGEDRTNWSSNINAVLGDGLLKGTASGASTVTFSSPTLPKKSWGYYTEPAIYTYYAPLLELDVRMSNADNVKDIVVYFKTNEGGSTEYSMSVNEYAFIKYDYSGNYEHMLYLPMYAHANWGDSETRYVTDLRIEIIPEDGKTLSGDFALSYVRPSLDTRHTNNNSIYISSLRQDYDYTGDLAFLEQNITRARKAMNFLMQFYDTSRSLIDSSYLVGHDADKTGSDAAQRAAHSLGNGYWDISYMPKYDFHSNSYFYKAVADMAHLENILAQKGSDYASDAKKAEANVQTAVRKSKSFATSNYSALDLTATAKNTLKAIQATTSQNGFWDATKGRFVAGYGDANADGTSEWVDYGYLAWNLEAVYYGIATDEQAKLIMQWVTGEREVAGDTSTREDIYFFEFAPRATTYQGSSETDSSVYTGVWHGTTNGGEYGVSQVQHGGAIMYTSYYDLMNRIAVNGADDAYTRLQAIKDWYMDVYAYYKTSENYNTHPDRFYWDYYENSQWDSNGDGKGEYWALQNGIKGSTEREDGKTIGIIGIDGEFLESFLPVAAIPYGFFGIEALGNGTLQIAPKLPGDLDYWTAENLTFGGCKYDVTIGKNGLQITAVRGETDGLTLKVALTKPAGDYKVYVNGFETTEYEEVENGQIIVELAFGNAIVEIR